MKIDRMTMQASIQIDLPVALLRRARVLAPVPARELVTFLLETYAQNLERSQRQQAYESYYCLARRFNLDPEGLMAANGNVELYPGTVLKIPATGTWTLGDRFLKAHPANYTVKSGDTIYRIACVEFGDVDPMNIALANNLAAPAYKLTVGQVLQIP